jgi:hypothetical protein
MKQSYVMIHSGIDDDYLVNVTFDEDEVDTILDSMEAREEINDELPQELAF